jgi:hypothetical protein
VPWHDDKWNGKTCCNVLDNSFCRILPKVDKEKDPDRELSNKTIDETNFPPCISEKGTFLSPNEYARDITHAWKDINPLFKAYGPCRFLHKAYSFNAVPFRWMIKSLAEPNYHFDPTDRPHKSSKAIQFEVDYSPDLEQDIDEQLGFEGNIWVQHPQNQRALLDTFFGCLYPEKSLIFFYAKHTPLSEPNERVIVGVARVRREVGPTLEYKFPRNYTGHQSYPWDRCVEHTLRPKGHDGFLLPYHEILDYARDNNSDLELHDYVAVAPDFEQFSFAAELVEHDTAIDALLSIAESLRKTRGLLKKSFEEELNWIDREISKLWDMRGAFPGLGPVLSAIGIESGNTIAWEIEKYILDKDGDLLKINPWTIFEESISEPQKYFGYRGSRLFNSTIKTKWANKPIKKKQFYKFVSRCQLNNDEAAFLLKEFATSFENVFQNPYILYERTRHDPDGLTFQKVDKALFPPEKIRTSFPLAEGVLMDNQLDPCRVRAASVWAMEEAAANEGHSLLSFDDLLNRLIEKRLEESFPIDEDTLAAQAEDEFFKDEILMIPPSADSTIVFLKLQRLQTLKEIILQRLNLPEGLEPTEDVKVDWLSEVNRYFNERRKLKDGPISQLEREARYEKAEALKILANHSFSVLIGPAGSGKTTLLEIFQQQADIDAGGVLKLAPTGKARVKLGPDAMTIAQFLYPSRYEARTGSYHPNKTAPKSAYLRNVIVDEASMLTEDQLAALLDALGPIDRFILVGDYRQLPPIGTGRPFFDIAQRLKPERSTSAPLDEEGSFQPLTGPAYAELTKNLRQPKSGDTRWDVKLSRCFSDSIEKDDVDIFRQISSGIQSNHLRLEKWYASDDFRELLKKTLEEELRLDPKDLQRSFNLKIGAINDGNYQYFNCGAAEDSVEVWQILSPVRGYGFGVKETNKLIQHTYRKGFVDLALGKARKIAKPKGTDNVVYGDKVINLRNSKWEDWQKIEPREKKLTALNYIANGEIGVITGDFRSRNSSYTGEPNIEITFSTQPGYSYVFKPKQLGDEGSRYSVELAYAITVHKAQGSGFKKVFLVLPSKGAILSRELLYTALTRQEDKVVILHQGEFRDFIRLASTDASATARRFTDLFYLPDIKQIENKYYDAKYVNVSERGERMISKNEVIIANLLNKYSETIQYAYEDKLKFTGSGRTVHPDFVIDNLITRKRFYWEHLGLMTLKDYRDKWNLKFAQYVKEGFVPHAKAKPTDKRVLIVTEENPNGGINSQELDQLIQTVVLR